MNVYCFAGNETGNQFVYCPCGLFPVPLARNTKAAVVNKMKAKTKFLGKFMAKALMDSRMVRSLAHPVLLTLTLVPLNWFLWYQYCSFIL